MTLAVMPRHPSAAPATGPLARPHPLLSVVVPTRNEQENVAPLVARVARSLASLMSPAPGPRAIEIIFVDDSDDDTPQRILALETPFPVKLIHREPYERDGGLTTAIVRGLRAARGEYLCVLDGDLQHPPEKLPEMLAAAEAEEADIVVASRYRRGGSASGLPGAMRRFVSVASKWMSKVLFYERLRPTSDPGSGFFLLRRSVIEGVELRPIGYKMLTEILVRGRWETVAEVPYRFEAREAGASKAGFRQGLQYLQHTARIFVEVPDVARLWKFLAVGASGVGVNLGLLWLCLVVLGAPSHVAWSAGVEASVLSNFWLNRTFTWRDRRAAGARGMSVEAARYHIASAAGVAANLVAFTAAAALDIATIAAGAIGIAAGVATNFAGAARFVFPAGVPTGAAGADVAPTPAPVELAPVSASEPEPGAERVAA